MEEIKNDKKKPKEEKIDWSIRIAIAFVLFIGFFVIGVISDNGLMTFLAFLSIPIALTGLANGLFCLIFERLKIDGDLKRFVYVLIVITYIGFWALSLINKVSLVPPKPIRIEMPNKLDMNITTPSYAPIRIESHHTNNSGRG